MSKRDKELDEILAVVDLEKRALSGDAEAQYLIWSLYSKGSHTISITAEGAFRYLQSAAAQGHAKANFYLGEMYMKNKPLRVDGDKDEADECFRKAASVFEQCAANDAEASLFLSAMYKAGMGVKRDENKSKELLKQAADLGNKVAIERLRGDGVNPVTVLRKALFGCMVFVLTSMGVNAAPCVKTVTAQQRYPWNGLVDIVVTMEGSADDMAISRCTFVATNSATGAAVPITSITRKGVDTSSGTTWIRRFVWNATNDVGTVKIDDLAVTVEAEPVGVQLWANGPYWAECNLGASKPEEYGYYFWWGDTVGYKRNAENNGWISVKDGTSYSFTGCPTYYRSNSSLQSEGYIDSSGNLVAAHDAATAHLGAPWRMPTDNEFSALINKCDTQWTTKGGVYGRLVAGRGAYASKSIFLPAAGKGSGSSLASLGSYGGFWSSTPNSYYSDYAWYLYSNPSDFYPYYRERYCGQPVRPVRGFAK